MRVTQITRRQKGNSITFSADFIFDKPFGGRKARLKSYARLLLTAFISPIRTMRFGRMVRKTIWFTVPKAFATKHNFTDAFFTLALPLAITTGEDLVFEGSVSPEAFSKVKRIHAYYHEVWRRDIKIQVTQTEPPKEVHQGFGQFFTLGVDSFYTLLCHKDTTHRSNRHLLYVDGYDVPFFERRFLNTVHDGIQEVARKMDVKSIFIETNLRRISDLVVGWGFFHVSALAGVTRFLNLQHVAISGESFEAADWGLRHGVDTLYSTKKQTLQLIAHTVSRDQKVRELTRSPQAKLFLRYVRVCWQNVRHKIPPYNCSVCQKCVKTKLNFMSLGVETPTFDSLAPAIIEKIHLNFHVYKDWYQLYERLKENPQTDSNILLAVRKVLEKPLRN